MKNIIDFADPSILSQDQVKEILNPHIPDLIEMVLDGGRAWERFGEIASDLRKPLNATCRANFIYNHIADSGKRRFQDKNGVLVVSDKYLQLIFEDKVVLRVKKLDDLLYCSGIPTQHYLEYMTQRCFPGLERTMLVVGYRLDASQTKIAQVAIICPVNQRRNKWTFELELQVQPAIVESIIAPLIDKEEKVTVSAKGIKKQKDNQG